MAVNQKVRNKRLQDFNDYILEGLQMVYKINKSKNGSYYIHTSKYGVIDVYPKADKLLFRNTGRWYNGGMEWLCNNL